MGLESARDVPILELLDDMNPGVTGGEEEAKLGKRRMGEGLVGESELGNGDLHGARVREAEIIKGDDGPRVGSQLCRADLGRSKRDERHQKQHDAQRDLDRHGWRRRRRRRRRRQWIDGSRTVSWRSVIFGGTWDDGKEFLKYFFRDGNAHSAGWY